jgi:hypothetical protein
MSLVENLEEAYGLMKRLPPYVNSGGRPLFLMPDLYNEVEANMQARGFLPFGERVSTNTLRYWWWDTFRRLGRQEKKDVLRARAVAGARDAEKVRIG